MVPTWYHVVGTITVSPYSLKLRNAGPTGKLSTRMVPPRWYHMPQVPSWLVRAIMKGELGVLYEEKPKSKRGYYVGIALVGAPKLVTTTIDSVSPRRALGSMASSAR